MVIDLGKPKVLKGFIAQKSKQFGPYLFRCRSAFAKILQKCEDVHCVIEEVGSSLYRPCFVDFRRH